MRMDEEEDGEEAEEACEETNEEEEVVEEGEARLASPVWELAKKLSASSNGFTPS